jgi:predicted CxxxxCH...CXXCH cytochrome family protein
MRTLYHHTVILILTSVFAFAAGCHSSPGSDSISSHQPHSREQISACTGCHSSTNSPVLDPLVTNGTGTSGKHVKHFQEHGIACERCHYNYQNAATHQNGTFDKGNPALVNMNIVGPAGAWDTATGRCSGVACHGTASLLWYSTNTWTTPSVCTGCHASGFSPALDPAATNGNPPNGRHGKHVLERNIGCERCHYQYMARTTHANGLLDTADASANLLQFNIVGPSGSWTGDTGPQTGQCANISCHGADTLGWYGTGTWTRPASCTTCHSSAYSILLDPLVTNGTDTDGKHINHVTNAHVVCSRCHLDYPTMTSHANGYMDTQDSARLLVYFDALNSSGTWTNDTGSETGNCTSLFCHGTDSPAWYGIAGVSSPPCAACHNGPIGSRRQIFGANGDFGTNPNNISHHVTAGPGVDPLSDQCIVCHEMSMHMGGAVRLKNADNGAAIAYDPASPSTLEPFCLSCHDAAGALFTFISGGTSTNPFNDGSVLGGPPPNLYQAGNKIAGYWNNSYTVHKNKGLTCAGTGQPATGCHGNNGAINMHGSVSKGLLTNSMTLPVPATPSGQPPAPYDPKDFKLCFDCHDSYSAVSKETVLGYRAGGHYDVWWAPTPFYTSGIKSLFRDRYIRYAVNYPAYWGGLNQSEYNDTLWGDAYTPLHNYHMTYTDSMLKYVWNYRGVVAGRASCTTCHNVHGTAGLSVRSTFDEFGIAAFFKDFGGGNNDEYKKFVPDANYSDSVMMAYPINCYQSCHLWPTTYWHTPADE